MQRWLRRAGSLLLLAFLFALLAWMNPADHLLTDDGESIHVIDGDSLRIGGRIIRIADMDAVELHQNCLEANGEPWTVAIRSQRHCSSWLQGVVFNVAPAPVIATGEQLRNALPTE